MPVLGIDLAAARGAQRARQDKAEQICRAWYKSPVWKAIKRHRLSQEPNCRQCAQEGRLIRRRTLLMSHGLLLIRNNHAFSDRRR